MLYISVHASPYNYKVMHEQKQTRSQGAILLAPHFPILNNQIFLPYIGVRVLRGQQRIPSKR